MILKKLSSESMMGQSSVLSIVLNSMQSSLEVGTQQWRCGILEHQTMLDLFLRQTRFVFHYEYTESVAAAIFTTNLTKSSKVYGDCDLIPFLHWYHTRSPTSATYWMIRHYNSLTIYISRARLQTQCCLLPSHNSGNTTLSLPVNTMNTISHW